MKIGDLVVDPLRRGGGWGERLPMLGVVIAPAFDLPSVDSDKAFLVAWTSGEIFQVAASWVKPYADEYDTLIK